MESSSSRVQAPVSTVATPTHLPSNPHFSSAKGEHSLADMARRDLDAALQLLADRAQYITGASGAAIALKRDGKKDMLCRASTGSNAPELGALLSTEFGLSGESVRTRQPLRCDDAERDVRVNREVCRQLGIASVVVMPVVNDDEVLGVFELFSGEVNAFGERDLSAVQRLSVMVETAVRLAQAAENLPERLRAGEISAPAEVEQDKVEQDKALAGEVLEELVLEGPTLGEVIAEEVILEDAVLQSPEPRPEVAAEVVVENVEGPKPEAPTLETPTTASISGHALSQKAVGDDATVAGGIVAAVPLPASAIDGLAESTVASSLVSPTVVAPQSVGADQVSASPQADALPPPSVETVPSTKQLFWSAALNPASDEARPKEADQSHIPPVLRRLCKCQACGFPVSAGRLLCVECEEKKWRGQLRVPRSGDPRQSPTTASVAPSAAPRAALAFAAAAQSAAGRAPVRTTNPARQTMVTQPSAQPLEVPSRDFVLSAGLEPSQSWLAANKYVIGVLLVVSIAVAGFILLR